ncbi:putative reverse transcriptase domain-containing protein, partial [Tanacetum coccineum]
MSVRPQTPMSATVEAVIVEYASVPTLPSPPPSPLSPLSSLLLQIPSPPLPLPSPPTTSPTYAKAPLGYKAARIRDDIPEADMPLRKRARFTAPTGRFEVGRVQQLLLLNSLDWMLLLWMPPLDALCLERLDMALRMFGMTCEARCVRQAWGKAVDCNREVHAELQAYRAQVQTHEIQIQTRDTRIGSLETLVVTLVAQTSLLQTQLTTALGRIQTLEAMEAARTNDPEDAGSSRVDDALAEHEANRSRNGDDSHDSGTGIRRQVPVARECTYTDFRKCQTLNFKGIEGVVGLTQWFEKMEFIFHISNCTVACQIKLATCTIQGNALTWWNSHVRTVGHNVAYAMTWKTLKKMMTDKYCPRCKIKKLEIELWNVKVKVTDVESYNQCFQELALMCRRIFPEESDEVEKYVGGLPDMIQGSVMGLGKRNHTKDLNLYALNETTIMMDSVLPSAPTVRGLAISPGTVEASMLLPTTREPKRQIKEFSLALSVELRAISRVISRRINPNSNVVTGTFLLNNYYASILFDTGADRSFVSTAFSYLIDIIPTTLDHLYDIELAG